MSPVRQEAHVDVLDLSLCNSTLWYQGRVRSTNVCAGYPEGYVDTCQGDSGGPLMCRRSTEDAYVIVGITSWGVGCARAKRPGIYTATWPYLNWIASKIGPKALEMLQPLVPSLPSVATAPATASSVRPSVRPPWYFQYPSQPPPFRPPASQPLPRPAAQVPSPPPPPPSPPPPPPPPSPTKPPEAPSFAKRLQRLIETQKGKALSGGRSSDDAEVVGFPELASLSTDPGNPGRLSLRRCSWRSDRRSRNPIRLFKQLGFNPRERCSSLRLRLDLFGFKVTLVPRHALVPPVRCPSLLGPGNFPGCRQHESLYFC